MATTRVDDDVTSELLAHAVLLRARAEDLLRLVSRHEVVLSEVVSGAARVAERSAVVVRLARHVASDDQDVVVPDTGLLLGEAHDD
jgi:hypothetical protein